MVRMFHSLCHLRSSCCFCWWPSPYSYRCSLVTNNRGCESGTLDLSQDETRDVLWWKMSSVVFQIFCDLQEVIMVIYNERISSMGLTWWRHATFNAPWINPPFPKWDCFVGRMHQGMWSFSPNPRWLVLPLFWYWTKGSILWDRCG